MITSELISRINELARLKKARGLTAEEFAEQAMLREQYLEGIRQRVEQTLQRVQIQEPDGTVTPLQKRSN